MKKYKWFPARGATVALCLSVLFVGACGSDPVMQTAPGSSSVASVANFQPITDFPMPVGTRLNAEESLILSGKDHWTGRMILESEPDVSTIFAFYQKEMPPLGWVPVASVLSNTSVLTFLRDQRTATVQIAPKRWGGSEIAITVATRQPGLPSPASPAAGGNSYQTMMPQAYPQQQANPGQPQDAQAAPLYQQQSPQDYR